MLNLYWKIFFGFWFTGLILVGSAIIINQQLKSDVPSELAGLSPSEIVNRTTFIIERLPDDLEEWRFQLSEQDIFLYTKNHISLEPNALLYPKPIKTLFDSLKNKELSKNSNLSRHRIAHKIKSPMYVAFALDMPNVNWFRLRELSGQITVQVFAALIVSAFACFVLARYLTRNLQIISRASKALAEGDLSARATIKNKGPKDEISLFAEDFNRMADAIQAVSENQKRLVRDISHELRSPLARIQIALEMSKHQHNPEMLERIELETTRLNDLIGQLLVIPEDKIKLDSIINILELIETITEDNQIEADPKNVSFKINTAIDQIFIEANERQMQSALENIIRNAVHYTDANTCIDISIKYSKENKGEIKIDIKDEGPGIPEEDIPYIFDPFYRVDPARNRKTGGYGVGLAIVRRVINNHNGKVTARNLKKGLCITVTLPFKKID